MLEERVYDEKELGKILKTQGQKNIKEKLKRYDIDFSVSTSDNSHVFEIHKINDKFKVFCILNLGFSANTDFSMLKHFIYYFYNNDEFRILSQNLMCQILEKDLGKAPCRQTIGKWLAQLENQGLYFKDISEYKYFSVYKGNFIEITREDYCQAWKAYFDYLKDCQCLIFDKRINFFKNYDTKEIQKGISFASIYICKNFLPKDLIFEKL